jgi:hypothetical protein
MQETEAAQEQEITLMFVLPKLLQVLAPCASPASPSAASQAVS